MHFVHFYLSHLHASSAPSLYHIPYLCPTLYNLNPAIAEPTFNECAACAELLFALGYRPALQADVEERVAAQCAAWASAAAAAGGGAAKKST